MVSCAKCGALNEDAARFCVNCGASLSAEKRKKRAGEDCFGPQTEGEECFGLPYGGAIVGVVFGIFIVLIGISIFLGLDIGNMIWPMAIVILGILIIAGAIYGLSRRPRR